jgi:hypothetical protein
MIDWGSDALGLGLGGLLGKLDGELLGREVGTKPRYTEFVRGSQKTLFPTALPIALTGR